MMNIETTRQHIRQARFEEAFRSIEVDLRSLSSSNQQIFSQLQSRYAIIKREQWLGTTDSRTDLNRIIWEFLDWLDNISRIDSQESGSDVAQYQVHEKKTEDIRLLVNSHRSFFRQFAQVDQELTEILQKDQLSPTVLFSLNHGIDHLKDLHALSKKLGPLTDRYQAHGGSVEVVDPIRERIDYVYETMSLLEVEDLLKEFQLYIKQVEQQIPSMKQPFLIASLIVFGLMALLALGASFLIE